MATKNMSQEQLAAAGIYVEKPQIEIIDNQASVDPIVMDADFAKLAADEAFMNEILKIRLATTTDPNAPPFATVMVNDINNRVRLPRGRPLFVKRLHVEVLARMRETRFTQPQRNPMDPEDGNRLVPEHAQAYPFEVLMDPNPMGRPWLERLQNEQTY